MQRDDSYSTDQNFADLVVLEHELKSFSIVFSMPDIHRFMGPTPRGSSGWQIEIGTLEAGKRPTSSCSPATPPRTSTKY